MTTREEVVRNRKRLYPAPKPAISREAFRNAYMTLKLAEKRLFQEDIPTHASHGPSEHPDGQHMQPLVHVSAGDNSNDDEEDAEPMDTDDVSGLASDPACACLPVIGRTTV